MTESVSTISPGDFHLMRADLSEMKSLMGRMVEVVTRIALLEERQQAILDIAKRGLERTERLEEAQHRAEVESARRESIDAEITSIKNDVDSIKTEKTALTAQLGVWKWIAGAAATVALSDLGLTVAQHLLK